MRSPKLSVVLILAGVLCSSTALSGSASERIDSYLKGVIEASSTSEFIDAYAVLSDRLGYDDLRQQTFGLARKARQAEVASILKAHSLATRGGVEALLREAESRGLVRNITIIWAINTISFSATPDVITDLAENSPEIEKIFFDPVHPQDMLVDDLGISKHNAENGIQIEPAGAPQIGLTLINAPAVWADGDSGAGVIVANVDTGTDWNHPDLIGNIWNNLGEDFNNNGRTLSEDGNSFDAGDINGVDDDGNGLVDDFLGWDYVGNDNDPGPFSSHGTSTSGIVAGHGAGGTQTGVAPRAKLMILEPSGESSVWTAMQYAVDMGADITTSSLSYKWYFSPQPNYPMWREMTDIELAAGMVHTNSTSNDGQFLGSAPIPYNISAPGNSPPSWHHPDQTLMGGFSSVLGAGNVHAGTDVVVASSPHGPSAWEDIKANHPSYPFDMPIEYQDYPYETAPEIGLLKPDVTAPGDGTTSLSEGSGYSSFGGTSGATPHVAGTAALLLGANPALEPADISRIIQSTSVEKGAAGKDSRYGAGRIDAYEAYLEATGDACDVCDLTTLQAKCVDEGGGTWNIKFRLVAFDEVITGCPDVVFDVNGTEYVSPWQNNGTHSRALNQLFGQPAGVYTVSLSAPEGCHDPIVLACGVGGRSSGEWQDLGRGFEGDGTMALTTVPGETELIGNYPNPFNPSTTISYTLATEGFVSLKIYNTLGQEIATLVNEFQNAGEFNATWNGTNDFGSTVASGIYLYRLTAGDVVQTERMLFMK